MEITRLDLERFIRADYSRRIRLNDDISRASAEDIAGKLREFDHQSAEPIVIDIISNGGNEAAAFLVAENLAILRSPTVAIVYGRCYSAAFTILQSCTLRYAVPDSRFMIHNVFKGFKLTPDLDLEAVAEAVKIQVQELRVTRERIVASLRRRLTHFSRQEVIDMMDEGRMIEVYEAMNFGMIDGTVSLTD